MSLGPTSPEQAANNPQISGTSLKLAEKLTLLPNIRATHDKDGLIKIESERVIQSGRIGAEKIGEEMEDEHEYGKKIVTGVNQLLEETFHGKNELDEDLTPDIFQRHSLRLEEIFKGNRDLLSILGEYDSSDYSKKSVLPEKGIPVEVGRAITVAVADHLIKTVRELSTDEATAVDDKFVVTKKQELQEEINKFTDQIEEKNRAEKTFANLEENKNKVVGSISEKLKKPVIEPSVDFSDEDLQFIKKEGKIFKKPGIKPDHFQKLDEEIRNIFGTVEELKPLGLSEYSAGPIVISNLEKFLGTSDEDAYTIHSKAMELFRGILPKEKAGILSDQQNLFHEFTQSKKPEEQDMAKNLAKGLLARAVCLHLVKKPGEEIKDQRIRSIVYNLPGNIGNFLEQTTFYKDTKQNKEKTEKVYKDKARESAIAENFYKGLEDALLNRQDLLKELETGKPKRVDKIRAKIAAELFISSNEVVPNQYDFEEWRAWKFKNSIFKSKLLTETVSSIFKGLPICIPEQDKESIIKNYLLDTYRKYASQDYVKEHLKKTVDYLPQLVRSIIPEKQPNADFAAKFISDMLRDYPHKLPTHGLILGARTRAVFENKQFSYRNYYVNDTRNIIQAILRGGEIMKIPKTEAPRVSLKLIWGKNWQRDETINEINNKAGSLKKWLTENAPQGSLVVSMEDLVRPDDKSVPGILFKTDDLLKLNSEGLFRSLSYFDKHPEQGYEFAPFYVIKPAKPSEPHQ